MKKPLHLGPIAGFVVLAAASLLLWWRPLRDTFALALINEAYTHIILIVPLSAALIYMDSKYADPKMVFPDPHPSWLLGTVLMTLALFVGCYARWGMMSARADVRLALGMFTFVAWLMASVLLCFGWQRFYASLFSLCFLFLLVPIPVFTLNWIVESLQQQSASAAQIMFRAIAVPVTQDGIMLHIPGLDIEVARECSSIRSSLMLLVTTLVLAHLFLHAWWRQVLLVAAAIPLSVAKNGLRIVTIAELGTRVDPEYLNGRFHHHGGIIFFAIAIVLIAALVWVLKRSRPELSGTSS